MIGLYGFLLSFGPTGVILTVFAFKTGKIRLPKLPQRKPKPPQLSAIEDLYNWKVARRREEHEWFLEEWLRLTDGESFPAIEAPKPKVKSPGRSGPLDDIIEEKLRIMANWNNSQRTIAGRSLDGRRIKAPMGDVVSKENMDGEIWYKLKDGSYLIVPNAKIV